MIDLKELQAAMDRCAFDSDVLGLSKSECASLLSMLREAEKDAARYRWLRNCATVESKRFVSDSGGWIVGLGVLDGMIDQAMKDKGDE